MVSEVVKRFGVLGFGVLGFRLQGFGVVAAAVSTVALCACADPPGKMDEFTERDCASKGLAFDAEGCVKLIPEGSCEPPAVGEVDGEFLWVIAAAIDSEKPLIFLANVTTAEGPNGLQFSMATDALLKDRSGPTGEMAEYGPFDVGELGNFETESLKINTSAAANPILDAPLEADVVLKGTFCAVDLSCGGVSGAVTQPTDLDLEGSTFTIQKIEEPGTIPEPMVDCEGTIAPPPS